MAAPRPLPGEPYSQPPGQAYNDPPPYRGYGPPPAHSPTVEFVAAEGSPVFVGPMAGRPAVGDCNGDGNPDIVIACGTC